MKIDNKKNRIGKRPRSRRSFSRRSGLLSRLTRSRLAGPANAAEHANHEADPERHARICKICHHPEREAIERDFLDWQNPRAIVAKYNLTSRSAIYRHAHALDLFRQRRRDVLNLLDHMINKAIGSQLFADDAPRASTSPLEIPIIRNDANMQKTNEGGSV